MIDLALAVGCSLAIGVLLKFAAAQGLARIPLLTANYAVALMMGAGLLFLEGGVRVEALSPSLGLLVLGTGGLFIGSFFVYAYATGVAGLSLSVGVMRLAVVMPFLASWWIWGEVPTRAQGSGLALAGAAFFLIAHRPRTATASGGEARRVFLALALLFASSGTVDVALKTYDEVFAEAISRSLFLTGIFGVAFLIGSGIVVHTRRRTGHWPDARTLGWGVVLGVVNYGSAVFFLRAIRQLSGPVVFPVNHIAIVLGGGLLGVLFWGERLTRPNQFGLALAVVALWLVSR